LGLYSNNVGAKTLKSKRDVMFGLKVRLIPSLCIEVPVPSQWSYNCICVFGYPFASFYDFDSFGPNIIGIETQNCKWNTTINLMKIRVVKYLWKGEINLLMINSVVYN
jgi:hypothetical protein